MRFLLASTFAAVVAAIPRPETLTNPAPETPAQIAHDQATALTLSPTSNVKGKAFDRFVVIWLENTDASEAFADRRSFFPPQKNMLIFFSQPTVARQERYAPLIVCMVSVDLSKGLPWINTTL